MLTLLTSIVPSCNRKAELGSAEEVKKTEMPMRPRLYRLHTDIPSKTAGRFNCCAILGQKLHCKFQGSIRRVSRSSWRSRS